MSNSRRSVVSFLLSAPVTYALGCERGSKKGAADHGPTFSVRNATAADADAGSRAGDAVWLALACTGPKWQKQLIVLLQEALAEVEANATPGLVDLFDAEASTLLHRRRGRLLPKLTAARVLVRTSWSDGELSVAPAESGFRAWKKGSDKTVRRAQFLIWPVSHALLLRNLPAGAIAGVRDTLADDSDGLGAAIALVITPEIATRRGAPSELTRLQKECRRVKRLLNRAAKKNPLASALADLGAATDAPILPWWSLRPDDLLLVPRLSALASRAKWVAQVQGVLKQHGASSVALVNK